MAKTKQKIQVAIADDHSLLRNALAKLIGTFEGYTVIFEADNGKDLRTKIMQNVVPDIVLLDINMPEMDGFETTQWLHKTYPHIKILALSMLSDEKTIIKMFRLGAKGYLLKNTDPAELKQALDSIVDKSVYLSEYVSGKLVMGLHQEAEPTEKEVVLQEKEREFLRWVCSELSYKEIAEKMFLSPRTIDDYRQSLFNKLKVHSRVGLVMYSIKNGIVEM
ncbi:response regulator transcription factor [Terrimonas sp. NA20]|uniref:Response regulator transcription factor n=1 Tax=Terrimonas ginsenosidimutans TaxID=2908004 RepID=A0ABS9KQ30_9BACT|nr:response regulator transcription factor [Terrimonas ginsenosidimutans]MCG2614437.1 response regulator transcription factor [Terrimonas ginsenosidimutans]